MQGTHRGFTIDYKRHNLKSFVVNDISGEYESLKAAEDAIDRHIKKNRKIDRLPVFIGGSRYGGYYKGFKKAEITSITESGEIWTVDENNNRAKLNDHSFCCEVNDTNKVITDKYLALKEEEKELSKQADLLLKTVDRSAVVGLIEKLKKSGETP